MTARDCPYGCSSNDNANTPCPHCDKSPRYRMSDFDQGLFIGLWIGLCAGAFAVIFTLVIS